MREPLVRATRITKRYGRMTVLNDVSMDAYPGEAVGLVGENGAGKTTLLRICAGLLRPDSGRVEVSGRRGYAPQHAGVIDLLTAEEHVILFGAGMDLSRPRALQDGRQILERLRYSFARAAVAKDLSGGTRQKLNLALALLGDPDVLLLDEPYQGFDRGTYADFWDLVDSWRAQGKAVIVVTHVLAELQRVDRVVELRVQQQRSEQRAAQPG